MLVQLWGRLMGPAGLLAMSAVALRLRRPVWPRRRIGTDRSQTWLQLRRRQCCEVKAIWPTGSASSYTDPPTVPALCWWLAGETPRPRR
jgi:hypothetical protein